MLVHLKGLTNLQSLDLSITFVSDAGLVHLKGLTKLQSLDLYDTKVTGSGLVHLKKLTKLQGLYLGKTKVTDAGPPIRTRMPTTLIPKPKLKRQYKQQVPAEFRIIEAESESDFELIEASADEDNSQKLRRFTMTAYGQFIQTNISTEKTRGLKLSKLYNLN